MNDTGRNEEPNSEDMHALAAAYALDAVDDDERAVFETHLASCPDCQREVAEFAALSVGMSDTLVAEPPPALRDRLLTEVAATPQDRVDTADTTPSPGITGATEPGVPAEVGGDELAARRVAQHRTAPPNRWWLAGVAAAAIAVGAVAVTQWPDNPSASIQAVQEVLDAPDAVKTTESLEEASVTVVTSYSLDRSVVQTTDMAAAPEGQDYQLWFVHGDETAISAGLLPRDGSQVLLEGKPASAVAVAITLEPAGGSEQPTSEPLVAVPLEG